MAKRIAEMKEKGGVRANAEPILGADKDEDSDNEDNGIANSALAQLL